jgi:hypothetical protein
MVRFEFELVHDCIALVLTAIKHIDTDPRAVLNAMPSGHSAEQCWIIRGEGTFDFASRP